MGQGAVLDIGQDGYGKVVMEVVVGKEVGIFHVSEQSSPEYLDSTHTWVYNSGFDTITP